MHDEFNRRLGKEPEQTSDLGRSFRVREHDRTSKRNGVIKEGSEDFNEVVNSKLG